MPTEISNIIKWDREHNVSHQATAEKIVSHLSTRQYIEADGYMIPLHRVRYVDLNELSSGKVAVHLLDGEVKYAVEFEAYRIAIQSQNLEGKPLRWVRHAWWFHNLVAHPVLQIAVWLGFRKFGMRIHDNTSPKPLSLRKREK